MSAVSYTFHDARLRSLPLRAVVLGALLGLIACDSGLSSDEPQETCTESGVQCQLPTGPLGVCERSQWGVRLCY